MNDKIVTRFFEAVNAGAEKLCRIKDAYTLEQAREMAEAEYARGGDVEVKTAYLNAIAYGFDGITVHDARVINDFEQRERISWHITQRARDETVNPDMTDALKILVRHWRQLNTTEKRIVAQLDAKVGKNDATATT